MSVPLDVLIVDDDQNMRLTLAEILSDDGYSVRVASSGEEAVELCRNFTFRLILMDVRMPGIDGLEAFRQIRRHCRRSQICLMSAYDNADLEQTALREGVFMYMRKPVEIEAVVKLLAEVTSTSLVYVGGSSDDQRALFEALERYRFRTTSVASVAQAVAVGDQICFDAAILDTTCPGVEQDGLALLRRQLPALPVILLRDESSGSEVNPEDAIAILTRPVKSEAVITLLEKMKRDRLHVRPT